MTSFMTRPWDRYSVVPIREFGVVGQSAERDLPSTTHAEHSRRVRGCTAASSILSSAQLQSLRSTPSTTLRSGR